MRWLAPTLLLARLRFATRSPGRVLYNIESISCPPSADGASRGFRERDNSHAAVKIHAVNTNRRIIFDAQINMFADTETKVASLREVLLSQFVFLHLEAALENFLGLGTADCDMDSDFFITSNAEGSDCVASFA